MFVWRIAGAIYDPLDGEGARRAGGRWNNVGHPLVYTAGTQALAILETLVHVDPDLLPRDYALYQIEIPDQVGIESVSHTELPDDWRIPGHPACRDIGDTWYREGRTAVLQVPAAPLHDGDEHGYVINPTHRDKRLISVVRSEPFAFDLRLI
jgi:RES domain-containing protein